MIQLNSLTIGYKKDIPLISDFSYVFENNKTYAIIGESGGGKTTLLRSIVGLTKPLSGEVIFNGMKVTRANKNDMYMMHQAYTCFDWLTCLNNILLAKKIKGKVTDEDEENALEMLKKVNLFEHKDKYPSQLSGGMKQRLALARTLFMQPDVILMDEPLSALDVETRKKMQDLIINLHKETKNTVILVTHSLDEAEFMGDIILKLKEGRLEECQKGKDF